MSEKEKFINWLEEQASSGLRQINISTNPEWKNLSENEKFAALNRFNSAAAKAQRAETIDQPFVQTDIRRFF